MIVDEVSSSAAWYSAEEDMEIFIHYLKVRTEECFEDYYFPYERKPDCNSRQHVWWN
jgi:hypothetical protein